MIAAAVCAAAAGVLLAYPADTALADHAKELRQVEQIGIAGENLVENSVSAGANTVTAQSASSLFEIELTELITEQELDGLAWKIAKIAIAQMTDSIISWINSGFQGSPAFVTDLSGFLLDVADQAAGDFIYNGPLQALCSPFRIDIQFVLALQYQQNRDAEQKLACRLTDVVDNVQGSLANSMNNWSDWFNVTLVPQNNLYGALMLAQHEMGVTITSAQGEQASLLNFGEGFLSFQECEEVEGGGEQCSIVKPGQVIEEQLEHVLGSGVRQLEMADKINEVINALMGQLLQQVMTGVGGLTGVSSGSYNGGAPYLEQMSEQTTSGSGETIGLESSASSTLQQIAEIEESFQSGTWQTSGSGSTSGGNTPPSESNSPAPSSAIQDPSFYETGIEAPASSQELPGLSEIDGIEYVSTQPSIAITESNSCEIGFEAFQDAAENEPVEYGYAYCTNGLEDVWINITEESGGGHFTTNQELMDELLGYGIDGYECSIVHNHPRSTAEELNIAPKRPPSSGDFAGHMCATVTTTDYVVDATGIWIVEQTGRCDVDTSINLSKLALLEFMLQEDTTDEMIQTFIDKHTLGEQELQEFWESHRGSSQNELEDAILDTLDEMPFDITYVPDNSDPVGEICGFAPFGPGGRG